MTQRQKRGHKYNKWGRFWNKMRPFGIDQHTGVFLPCGLEWSKPYSIRSKGAERFKARREIDKELRSC